MVYKFINETQIEEYTKKYVIVDDKQISHPSAETLLKAGIKPLVVEDTPLYNEETQYAEHYFVDGETEITQKWQIVDIPDEVIDDEIANA
jgi:hypothetical protein